VDLSPTTWDIPVVAGGNPLLEQDQKQSNTLPITALILSCLICVPLLPLVGLVLGIVALTKSRRTPQAGGTWLAIVAIVCGLFGTVFSAGIGAAMAIPAFIGYIRQAKIAEAEQSLERIVRSAESAAAAAETKGAEADRRLPPSAPLTPPFRCCEQADGRCPPEPSLWEHPSWHALGFFPAESHYYQYEFVSDGQSFTARALGDLDCDGVMSTFERSGQINAQGQLVITPGLRRISEDE
jgi:hypothetical protein